MSGRAYRSQSTTKSGQQHHYKTATTSETLQDEVQCNEKLLRSILYDFNQSTTTQEKLSQMKNCLNELPLEMIRNVAFLPSDEKTNQKEPKTSKEILDKTKGFTTKMRVSFMRIKNSLDPNINASTLQNFFKKKQQESQRIQENYGYTPEIKDPSRLEQSISPQKVNPFLTPQSQNAHAKQIRNKINNNAFNLQLTGDLYVKRRNVSEILESNQPNYKQNKSFHQIQTDSDKTFNNSFKLSPLNCYKFQQSEHSTSDSPKNFYSKMNSTQDQSTISKNKINLVNIDEQQRLEQNSCFYDIPQSIKTPTKQLNQLVTPRAQTTRSLSNNAGRKQTFLSDQKKDILKNDNNNNNINTNNNIFHVLHTNYNNNPNYPCQKNRTDLTTQNKTTTEGDQDMNFKTNENIPTKTDYSPQRKSTNKLSEEGFFQKKIRRNALIDLRKLNPNIQKMTQYSKDFLPPWLRARPDFLKLYLQDQINKNLQLPTIFVKEQD